VNISEVKNIIRVGNFIINPKKIKTNRYVLYSNGLKLIYDDNFPHELKFKQVSLIYFFVVNGKIYKIGQSSSRAGIRGCMGFYMCAGQDDPGLNRFAINYLIRQSLENGDDVEIYMKYQEPVKQEVEGLFGKRIIEVPISAKGMEEFAIEEYLSREGKYPIWNYQESGEGIPNSIQKIFGKYKIDRKSKLILD
jgi:hypothetical protein